MYIQLNSQILCYEKTGEGSPVILIHGNCEDHHIFDPLAETMSRDHMVYSLDSRGHGESATPREFHYKDMADDVINLIKALDIEKPYLLGFSDGAIVALLVAIKASNMISGIICCGANLSPAGFTHKEIKEIKKAYKKTNDPRIKMMLEEPNITTDELKMISVPAMVFAGENDCIKEKETKKISETILDAELKILRGHDHASYILETDAIYPLIKDFLR